jgi:hypothetical protein
MNDVLLLYCEMSLRALLNSFEYESLLATYIWLPELSN